MNGTMNTERIERTGRGDFRARSVIEAHKATERRKARKRQRRAAENTRAYFELIHQPDED